MTDLLADRYRVIGQLDPVGGVPRDLALDVSTESRVELARFAAGGAVPAAFEAMARHYGSCRHPCLAPVLDVVVPPAGEGSPVVVEGHADGPRLQAAADLPRPAALLLAADVADALAALHGAGLVHGALGPEAIVIDPVGRPMVMGAGSRGLQAIALGSPEPAQSADDDVRALGGVLYALVVGRPPDPVPVAPASATPGIDPTLNGLILAILSDDPLRPPPPAAAVSLRLRDLAGVGGAAGVALPPAPPRPPAPFPAYAYRQPAPRQPRRGYSDVGIIGAATALAVAGVLAAYAFSRLEDDVPSTLVVSTAVSTVVRVVPVPGGVTVPTEPTDQSGIVPLPTEETTAPTDSFPLTLTDIVTETDPFVIPTVITEVQTVTVTQSETAVETEFETETFTDTGFTDTEATDTDFTDTDFTDTGQ